MTQYRRITWGQKTNYKELYYIIFNAATDALDSMEHGDYDTAKRQLIAAQQKTEEIYMNVAEEDR